MIAANELRIGNWVNIRLIGIEEEGTPIQCNASHLLDISEDKGAFLSKKCYEPIPLTPEVLEKSGFIKTGVQGEYINCYGGILHVCFDRIGLISYRIGDMNFTTVHYVHQLQNLYFALTGQEIKININHTTPLLLH